MPVAISHVGVVITGGGGVVTNWTLVQENQALDDINCTEHILSGPVQVTEGIVKEKLNVPTIGAVPIVEIKLCGAPTKFICPVGSNVTVTAPDPSEATTCQVIVTVVPTFQMASGTVGWTPAPHGLVFEGFVFHPRGTLKIACPWIEINKKENKRNWNLQF